jgi:RNA polymerase sigma-70 factor (ECF subfamily)
MFGTIAIDIHKPSPLRTMDLNEEQQLVEDAKTDSASFGKLYDYYFPKIYGYIAAKVNDRDDVEDLVSTTFMKALENLPKYEWRGIPFAAWLFTIARNTLNNYYVKSGKNRHLELDEGRLVVDKDKNESPMKKAEQEELADKVKKVLNNLPEREITVVQLKFFSQMTNREIMDITGLSESNVAVILYRTLRKIKSDLKYFA